MYIYAKNLKNLNTQKLKQKNVLELSYLGDSNESSEAYQVSKSSNSSNFSQF